jgi:hypothetical protein
MGAEQQGYPGHRGNAGWGQARDSWDGVWEPSVIRAAGEARTDQMTPGRFKR